MTKRPDIEINCDIRAVLVRHWIDLGKVLFRSSNGSVWMRGSVQRIPGVKTPLTPPIMENVFSDLKRIRGVSCVYADFENWAQQLGRWQPIDKTKALAPSLREGTGTLDISDKD